MKKVKQLITAVAICLLAVFAPRGAMGQTTCPTSIMLGAHDTVIAPFTLSDTTRWYDFTANDSSMVVALQADTINAPLFRLELYTSTCAGQSKIIGDTAMGFVSFEARSLSIGTHYKLKLTIDNPTALSVSDVSLRVKSMGGGGGTSHSLFLCNLDESGLYGTIYSSGADVYGQLGIYNNCGNNHCSPTQVISSDTYWAGRRFKAVAAGSFFSLALDDKGHVWAWGRNEWGELGNGAYDDPNGTNGGNPILNCNPERVTFSSGVLLGDENLDPQKKIIAISAGMEYALALAADGTVYGWGNNDHNQLLLNNAGSFVVWPVELQILPQNYLHKIIAISAGSYHALAMDDYASNSSGHVWAWGDNSEGQFGNGQAGQYQIGYINQTIVPQEMNGIVGGSDINHVIALAISAGGGSIPHYDGQSMVIYYDINAQMQRLAVCGSDFMGQLGLCGVSNQLYLDHLMNPYFAANYPGPPPFGVGIGAIGGAREHSLVVDLDGYVWGVGNNYRGCLANIPSTSCHVFKPISGLTNIRAVTGGNFKTFAYRDDGVLYAFGENSSGELGLGFYTPLNANPNCIATPTQVSGLCPISISGTTPICSGHSSTLTLSGANLAYPDYGLSTGTVVGWTPVDPINYVWSSIPGSTIAYNNTIGSEVTVNPVTTTTYTATNGQQTASFQVQVYQSPVFTITPHHASICLGESATISVTNATPTGGIYHWEENGVAMTQTTSSITVTPSSTSTYTFTYTAPNGCSTEATVVVTVNPLPASPVISGDPSACSTVTPVTYTIANFQASNINQYNINITNGVLASGISTTGTFTVTWNATAVSNGGSISITFQDPVTTCVSPPFVYQVSACCFNTGGNLTIYDQSASNLANIPGLILSTIGSFTVINSSSYSINGTLTVDHDLKISNANILMGTNAKIIISPGFNLEITGSHLSACTLMWDGIYESSSMSKIVIDRSILEDAKNALTVSGGGQYSLWSSIFNRNYSSLAVIANPASMTTNEVYGCYFTCRNLTYTSNNSSFPFTSNGSTYSLPMSSYVAPPNPLVYLKPAFPSYPANTKSFTGIEALLSSSLTFGKTSSAFQNVFDNMDNGIVLSGAAANVYNNLFWNFKQNSIPPPCKGCPQPPPSGNAIYATDPFTFFAGTHTLQVGGANAYEPNHFEVCTIGINSANYHNKIFKNDFKYMYNNGISLSYGNLRINDIEDNTFASVVGGINCMYMSGTSGTLIKGNHMNITGQGNPPFITNYGIYVGNASLASTKISIETNKINYPSTGIYMFNVKGGRIEQDNEILFTTTGTVGNPKSGIKVVGCAALTIGDNKVTYASFTPNVTTTLRGIHIQDTPNSAVFRNVLTHTGAGVYVYGDCDVARLECNEFHDCFNGFVFKNYALTGAKIGDQLPQIPGYIGKSTGNKWFNMASSNFNTGNVFTWMVGSDLHPYWYWETGNDPSLSTATFLHYFGPVSASNSNDCSIKILMNRGDEREINCGKIVRGENTYDTLGAEYLQRDSIYAFHYLKSNDTLLHLGTPDDELYQNFFAYAKTGNIGKFSKVIALVQDTAVANAADAKTINQNIITHTSKEDNAKMVNNIYLNKVAYEQDSTNTLMQPYPFDSAETATLMNVAYQNPFMGGDAVYMARVLLFMDLEDDVDIVEKMMITNNHKESTPSNFVLYPNPNNGNFTLGYHISDTDIGVLSIFDITGKFIKSYPFNSNETSININGAELNAGVYFYEVMVNDRKVKMDKLIIVK